MMEAAAPTFFGGAERAAADAMIRPSPTTGTDMQIGNGAAGIAAGLLLSAATTLANAQVINGSFESGLSPWATHTTANGTAGPGGIHLADFDIDGDGIASKTVAMSVGYAVPPCDWPGHSCPLPVEGAGIFQWSHFSPGETHFHVDLAVENAAPYGYNVDGGTFQLILGGTILGEWSVDRIDSGAVIRGAIDVTDVVAGPIDTWFMVRATRGWAQADGLTQYIDNVSITPTVPEPATNALLLAGVAAMAAALRRKRPTA